MTIEARPAPAADRVDPQDRRALFIEIARTVCERFDIRGERDTTYIADTLAERIAVEPAAAPQRLWQQLDAAVFQLGAAYARQVMASERRELKDLIARSICQARSARFSAS
ncbi:MAG: hypothetical protein AB7P21_08025 [Lautropia sp.]